MSVLIGKIAVLPDDNVDTDRIIPARFLTMVTKSGYGQLLFNDVRGPEFPLDQAKAEGATILVTGTNFGCGSSREHAVWALQQAGFAAVIARREHDSPGFSDIFRQNSANCGLLLIELDAVDHQTIAERGSGAEITIDLPSQKIIQHNINTISFDILSATKSQLMKGLDLVGTTLEFTSNIDSYEKDRGPFVPQTV